MERKEAFLIALQSLWANKLRSVLTMLGVIIAVASLIAVVTLINGANTYVATKINNQGADVFTISKQPTFTTNYKEYVRYQKRKIISMEQFLTLQQECTSCKQVGALQGTQGSVKYLAQLSKNTEIRGYTEQMPEMQNLNITQGRSFIAADEQHSAHVAIIGYDIYESLLKFQEPVGKEIRVDGVPYTVIGLGEKQGKTLGQSQDNWVAVPLSTFQRTYGSSKTLTIYAKAPGGADAMEEATDQARLIMRELRHDRLDEADSFTLSTSDELAGLAQQIGGGIGAVAVAITAISLVVGGVVIMNIMLVSVTERTREIGVRKALGAKKADLLLQFLLEAATLSTMGGVLGVAAGVGVAIGISVAAGFPAVVSAWSVVVGLIVALAVGVFFGVYPARKAAELDPIVALRSEF
jgi:putative ABC transport system permease protein